MLLRDSRDPVRVYVETYRAILINNAGHLHHHIRFRWVKIMPNPGVVAQ